MTEASDLQLLGAGGFGALIGWFIYSINRYRTGEVKISDLVSLIGAIGGAAVLELFAPQSDLFGAYGIGLFVGFFGYFLVLLAFVLVSDSHKVTWFLDGRSKKPAVDEVIPAGVAATVRPMGAEDTHGL